MNSNKDMLVKEFLIESSENLSSINEEITRLERKPDDKDTLNSIYRAIHTLKGSASFLGYKKLMEISHATESLLDCLREKTFKIDAQIVDVLLASCDLSMLILKNVEKSKEEGKVESAKIVKDLFAIIEQYSNGGADNVNQLEKVASVSQLSEKMPIEALKEVSGETPAEIEVKVDKNSVKRDQVMPAPSVKEKIVAEDSSESKSFTENLIDSTVRVNVNLLDKIMNVVGELVLNRNQILQYSNFNENADLSRLSQQLNTITTELQTDIMTTRMQPVGTILTKFERVVRDLSKKQSKKIKLAISGQETELDKTLLEAIKDPLSHLIRNAADHGLETAVEREEANKSAVGLISIRAYHEGGQVTIEIQDDGKGLDQQKIINNAVEKNIINSEEASNYSEKQIHNLIFRPGFSTAEKVTNISGRGVGMDVVKTNVEKIGGVVDVTSTFGVGTTFKLKIPLTLAIVPALIVQSLGEHFAIPQINLVELVRLEGDDLKSQVERIHNSEFIRLRNTLVPIFRLNTSLRLDEVKERGHALQKSLDNSFNIDSQSNTQKVERSENEGEAINIVILNAEGQTYGLIVDIILDTQEIVVKPLSLALKKLSLFAGATIMGDGKVALIIDALGFFNKVGSNMVHEGQNLKDAIDERTKNSIVTDKQEFILFSLGDDLLYGIPLSQVNRLEEFTLIKVELSGQQPLIRYRNIAMPLINLEKTLNFNFPSLLEALDEKKDVVIPALVVLYRKNYYGLVVKNIIDIATTAENINTGTIDREGLIGTVFVNEKTVSVLDIGKIVKMQKIGANLLDQNMVDKKQQSKRILIVEDSPMYRKLESELFLAQGHQVEVANHGKAGLEILNGDGQFDLIITDIEMPEMNGLDFVSELRKNVMFKEIPVVGITTKVSDEDRQRGVDVGINDYLEKFDQDEILQVVNSHLYREVS